MSACLVQEVLLCKDIDADSSTSSESEIETTRPNWARRHSFQHQATKQKLRAFAPDGLLIEDILRRIEFDPTLPSLSDFRAFVDLADKTDSDRAPTPRGAKWCRRWCWTGRCRYGTQCWYSHAVPHFNAFGHEPNSLQRPPGSNKAPYSPMEMVDLSDIALASSFAIRFLLYEGSIVWGRDLGFSGDLWNQFVASRKTSGQSTDSESDDSSVAEFCDLPQAVLEHVIGLLSVEDLVPTALAIGPSMDWTGVIEARWPMIAGMTPTPTPAHGGLPIPPSSQSPALQLASLVEASRLASQLLKWPPRDASVSFGSGTSPAVSPNLGPATPPQSPPLTSVPITSTGSRGEVDAIPFRTACGPVLEWQQVCGEPACIRFESEVHTVSLRQTMVGALSCNGEIRIIRRNDLKQITSLKIKDASCFDVCGELLVVGTVAPARLTAFDLSTSTPKMMKSLQLGARSSVIDVLVRDSETCLCGVACEETPGKVEVLLLDCQSQLRIITREVASGFFGGGPTGCLTSDTDGRLVLWDVTAHVARRAVELPQGPDMAAEAGPCGPMMLAAGSGPYVAATAPLRCGAPVWSANSKTPETPPIVVAKMDSFPGALEGRPSLHRFKWSVDLIHLEGSLLIVVAKSCDEEEWSLTDLDAPPDLDSAPLVPEGPRLFAWHLPTCRPLLIGHPTLPITTFARSHPQNVDPFAPAPMCGMLTPPGGCLAFAGTKPRDGRASSSSYYVIVPGAGTVRRPSRRGGLPGPMRRAVQASDVRARGFHPRGRQNRR